MARSAPICTMLSVGVLLGSAVASAAASAQTSGTWATTGSMTRARLYDTATVLQNGQVLAVLSVAASPLSVSPATHPGSAASWLRYHAHASNNAVIAEPGWCPVT